jgi:hypothetical protein
MADQKISQLTQKQTLVDADVITILDSENNLTNKKALISALPKEVPHFHDLGTVTGTFSNGVLSLTANQTEIVNGDLYGFVCPITNNDNATTATITIGSTTLNLRSVVFDHLYENNAGLWQQGFYQVYQYIEQANAFALVFDSMMALSFNKVNFENILTCMDLIPATGVNLTIGSPTNRFFTGFFDKLLLSSSNIPVAQNIVTSPLITPSITSVESHTVYKYTNALTSLTIGTIPSDTFEAEIQFTTRSSFIFTASSLANKWIGGTPTFEPNKSYVIAIKNGLAAWGEVS